MLRPVKSGSGHARQRHCVPTKAFAEGRACRTGKRFRRLCGIAARTLTAAAPA